MNALPQFLPWHYRPRTSLALKEKEKTRPPGTIYYPAGFTATSLPYTHGPLCLTTRRNISNPPFTYMTQKILWAQPILFKKESHLVIGPIGSGTNYLLGHRTRILKCLRTFKFSGEIEIRTCGRANNRVVSSSLPARINPLACDTGRCWCIIRVGVPAL